jgi:hypothetical protein
MKMVAPFTIPKTATASTTATRGDCIDDSGSRTDAVVIRRIHDARGKSSTATAIHYVRVKGRLQRREATLTTVLSIKIPCWREVWLQRH